MDRVTVIFDLLTEMPPELAREHHFEQQPRYLTLDHEAHPGTELPPQEPPRTTAVGRILTFTKDGQDLKSSPD